LVDRGIGRPTLRAELRTPEPAATARGGAELLLLLRLLLLSSSRLTGDALAGDALATDRRGAIETTMRRALHRILRRTADARRAGVDRRGVALHEMLRRTGVDDRRMALQELMGAEARRAGIDY
jgi:hypothetical protein